MPTRVVDAGVSDSFPRDDFPRDNFPRFIMVPRAEGACRGRTMKLSGLFLTAALAAAAISGASAAGATTYVGTQKIGNASTVLTVVTNGDVGALTAADILEVTADIRDQYGNVTVDSKNGYLAYFGGDYLSATATNLTYTITPGFSEFDVGSGTGNLPFFCIGGTCGDPSYKNGPQAGISFDTAGRIDPAAAEELSGNVQLGAISAAPEPGTWLMMFAGVAMIGRAMRYRSRRPQGILVA